MRSPARSRYGWNTGSRRLPYTQWPAHRLRSVERYHLFEKPFSNHQVRTVKGAIKQRVLWRNTKRPERTIQLQFGHEIPVPTKHMDSGHGSILTHPTTTEELVYVVYGCGG